MESYVKYIICLFLLIEKRYLFLKNCFTINIQKPINHNLREVEVDSDYLSAKELLGDEAEEEFDEDQIDPNIDPDDLTPDADDTD